MFKGPISSLVTNADEQNVLFTALLQRLEDNGGSLSHLNKLLADAKGEGEDDYLDDLARNLMGPIWDLVRTPVDLGHIEYRYDERALSREYPDVMRKKLPEMTMWSESRPTFPCKYKLMHFQVRATYDEIRGSSNHLRDAYAIKGEYAGSRELVAYVARLQSTVLDLVQIVAPGSELHGLDNDPPTEALPIATRASEYIEVGWKSLDRSKDERFERNTFYLVRVPA